MHSLYTPMRTVAAAARARLVTAAAQRFGVDASTLATRDSIVVAPDGRTATYGSLSADGRAGRGAGGAGDAEGSEPVHADRASRRRASTRATSSPARRSTRSTSPVAGAPTVVARAPTIGGSLRTVDDSAARAHARRPRHRAHPDRRRGRGDDVRSGPGGTRRAAHHLGSGPERRSLRRADPCRSCRRPRPPFVVAAARQPVGRPASSTSRSRRTRRSRCYTCVADVRSRLGRDLVRRQEPDRREPEVARRGRPSRRQGHAPRRARRRLVRAPALLRARDRGRAGVEGVGPPDQADVDAQRRHAPRADAAGEPPQGARDATCSATCSPTSTDTRRCPSTSRTVSARRSARSGSTS